MQQHGHRASTGATVAHDTTGGVDLPQRKGRSQLLRARHVNAFKHFETHGCRGRTVRKACKAMPHPVGIEPAPLAAADAFARASESPCK